MGDTGRRSTQANVAVVYVVVNAAAGQYRGHPRGSRYDPVPADGGARGRAGRDNGHGVDRDGLAGVIGVQARLDVTRIRHLYVRPDVQNQDLGTTLLETAHERADADTILGGTWAAADWAFEFYEVRGFELLGTDPELLSTHRDIPEHNREASVVLRYAVGLTGRFAQPTSRWCSTLMHRS